MARQVRSTKVAAASPPIGPIARRPSEMSSSEAPLRRVPRRAAPSDADAASPDRKASRLPSGPILFRVSRRSEIRPRNHRHRFCEVSAQACSNASHAFPHRCLDADHRARAALPSSSFSQEGALLEHMFDSRMLAPCQSSAQTRSASGDPRLYRAANKA
jgi:hypothetical protein